MGIHESSDSGIRGLDTAESRQKSGSDRFSTWSVLLIALTFVLQIVLNDGNPAAKKVLRTHSGSSAQTVSTDSFQQLIAIDFEVKLGYAISLLPASDLSDLSQFKFFQHPKTVQGQLPLSPFHQAISSALSISLSALRKSPDSVYFARRVILLRGLLNIPPLESIESDGKTPGLSSPLEAYDRVIEESPTSAAHTRSEEDFWRKNFSVDSIPRAQLGTRLMQLNQFPTLLFYHQIARLLICSRAGDNSEAIKINRELQIHCLYSTASMSYLTVFIFALFAIGIVVWIGFAIALYRRNSDEFHEDSNAWQVPGVFDRFVKPAPDLISPEARKLRAGDLLDCFAIYLVLLTGFGTGLSLLLRAVPQAKFDQLSQLELIYCNIGLTVVSYVGASSLALWVLAAKAKRANTTLSTELGLSTRNALRNVAFGMAGWGASLVLLIIVSQVSEAVFHAFPAPANPVLPMLAFAPDTLSRFALYGVAAVAAPFFEETFFRGVLLNALLLRFRPAYACLITGLMFGGIHPVGIAQALSLSALGVVFAWMAYLRKSLAPSMFAHFLQNSYAYLAVYFSFAIIAKF